MKRKILQITSFLAMSTFLLNIFSSPTPAFAGNDGSSGSGGSGSSISIPIPSISNLQISGTGPYNPTANNLMTFSYDYKNLNSSAAITLRIYHMLGNLQSSVKTWNPSSNTTPAGGGTGTFSISWDGTGDTTVDNDTDYYFEVSGTSGSTTLTTIVAGPFEIDNTLIINNPPPLINIPSLTSLTVVDQNQLPYAANLGTPLKFNYSYSNLTSGGVDLTFEILRSSTVVHTDVFNGLNAPMGSGNLDYSWDGKDNTTGAAAVDGNYTIKISGTDTNNNQVVTLGPLTLDFAVQNFSLIIPPAPTPTLSNPQVLGGSTFYNFTANPMQFTVDYKNFTSGILDARVYYKLGLNQEIDVVQWGGGSGGIQIPFQGNGTKTYNWDGLDNLGQPADDGTYYFEVSGTNNGIAVTKVTSSGFTITNPTFSNITFSQTDYDPNVHGLLKIGFDIANLLNSQKADAYYLISNVNQNVVYFQTVTGLGNGHQEVTWDGAGSVNGAYVVKLLVSSNGVSLIDATSSLSSIFNVVGGGAVVPVNPDATVVSGLQVTPDPYDPSKGSAVLGYTVSNWLSSTVVDATIYDLNNNILGQWNGVSPVSGANTITWAAPNSLADGLYLFEVKGAGIATAKIVFTVDNTVSDLPPGTVLCSIFPDNPKVAADSDDCKAIQYFKEKGVFTGTAEGNLDPYGLLQRDQVTKVLLTGFAKYDDAIDYCAGTTPLKDIGQGAWYDNYVCRGTTLTVAGNVMITGYSAGVDKGYFRPDWKVNRAEFAALLFRLFGTAGSTNYTDVQATDWWAEYSKSAKFYDLFSGETFDAEKNLPRFEVIQVLYKLHQADSAKL